MGGPLGVIGAGEVGLAKGRGVDVAVEGHVLKVPLGEKIEVVAAAVFSMTD
jgi:hypothetical protein